MRMMNAQKRIAAAAVGLLLVAGAFAPATRGARPPTALFSATAA